MRRIASVLLRNWLIWSCAAPGVLASRLAESNSQLSPLVRFVRQRIAVKDILERGDPLVIHSRRLASA